MSTQPPTTPPTEPQNPEKTGDCSDCIDGILDALTGIQSSINKISGPQKKDCSYPHWEGDVDCEDLEQQKSMSKMARWLFGATLGQILLSGAGFGALMVTIGQARRANRIALKANGPFIDVVGAEIRADFFDSFMVEIAVRNTGNSSASDLHFRGSLRIQHGSDGEGNFPIGTPEPYTRLFSSNFISVAPKTINVTDDMLDGWRLIYDCLRGSSSAIAIVTQEHVEAEIVIEGVISHTFMEETIEHSIYLVGHELNGPVIYLQGTDIHPRAKHYEDTINQTS